MYTEVIPHLLIIQEEAEKLGIFFDRWSNSFIDDDSVGVLKVDEDGNIIGIYIEDDVVTFAHYTLEEVLRKGVDYVEKDILPTPPLYNRR